MNINSSNVGSLKKQTTFSFNYASIRNSLRKLRSLKSFIIYILPISLLLGLVFPEASESLNSLGLSLIQLISFPAIPLVLAAVVLSTHSILTISKSQKSKYNFTRRLFLTLITIVIFVSLLALLLALYQKPGILSPDGKLSIGRYMLDVTDINLSLFTVNDGISDNFKWFKDILPVNIIGDASKNETLKVITGSCLLGWGLSLLSGEKAEPLLTFIRSIYDVALKVLDELLLIAPLVIICLIAGSFATISSEMIVALLNLTICMLLGSIAALGISRLIYKRFTSLRERKNLQGNPADSVFLLGLSTGSSLACYPTIIRSMENLGRNTNQSEVAASLSLLVSSMGNIIYNIIAIIFALNLFEVVLTPYKLVEVLILGIVTGVSAAGLTGVSVVPTIGLALTALALPVGPVLVLLLAVDPILTLPRAATTAVLSMAICTICSEKTEDMKTEENNVMLNQEA
jgi:Na+/H+-dicarboxylate symporter